MAQENKSNVREEILIYIGNKVPEFGKDILPSRTREITCAKKSYNSVNVRCCSAISIIFSQMVFDKQEAAGHSHSEG